MVQISPLIQAFSALAQAASQQTSSNELAVRQSPSSIPLSELPSQCQSVCEVFNTIIGCGSNQSCICASSVGAEIVSCTNCLDAAEPNNSNLQSASQTLVNDWNQLCGGHLSLSGSSSSSSGKSGAVSLRTAGLDVCVVAAAIGGYMVL